MEEGRGSKKTFLKQVQDSICKIISQWVAKVFFAILQSLLLIINLMYVDACLI